MVRNGTKDQGTMVHVLARFTTSYLASPWITSTSYTPSKLSVPTLTRNLHVRAIFGTFCVCVRFSLHGNAYIVSFEMVISTKVHMC